MRSIVALAVSIAIVPGVWALAVLPSRPEKAARVIEAEAVRLGSAELLQLGDEVRQPAGDLDNVKKMIANMILKHQSAQADDTDHKAFCDKEMVASKSKVTKLKTEIQKRTADQDLHSAELAELKDSIGDIHSAIAQTHKDQQKASELREKEADAYKQATAAWDKSLQELRRQLRSESQEQRQAAEKAEEEITLKKVRAENKEDDAQFKSKKLVQELAVAIARKTKEVEQKEHKVVSMTHELSLGDGDFKMAQEEMSAAKEYADKIKSSCTVRVDPAKERAQARKHQITSLKEAYGILTGDDIPVYR